jgi:uncharacterized protein YdaU (DUF1376 family)
LFYSNDFLTGTSHMTREEKGLYIELLCHQQQKGPLSIEFIKRIAGQDFEKLWGVVSEKFQCEDNLFFNKRMSEEAEKRKKYSESRATNRQKKDMNNICKTYEKDMSNISKTYEEHMENENENENEIRVIELDKDKGVKGKKEKKEKEGDFLELWPTFEDFWNLYDKKEDRGACEKKWEKLKQREKEQIMESLPLYIVATPEKKFRKNPETYLNRRAWENEVNIPPEVESKASNLFSQEQRMRQFHDRANQQTNSDY